jgi:hypothetical protein
MLVGVGIPVFSKRAMSDAPMGPGYWQASDGRWYAPELHPPVIRTLRTAPPSADKALIWTLLAAFWLWFLLPVAVFYTRKARREVEASGELYEWSSRNLLHRPNLLWFVVFGSSMVLMFAMVLTGIYGD